MGIKKAEFEDDIESVHKYKKLIRKQLSTKKIQKNGVFDTFYISVCKSFRLLSF
jgi:hypothetical protein